MKAVIVKLSSLGDIVQALPVAAYLKGRGCTVTWVVEKQFSSLVSSCPFVDKVIELPLRSWKTKTPLLTDLRNQCRKLRTETFDVLFDLQGNCKSALVTALLKAKDKVGFGRKTISEWPALFACHFHFDPEKGGNVRDEYLELPRRYFADSENIPIPPIFLRSSVEPIFTTEYKKITVSPGAQWSNKELKWETLLALIQKLDRAMPIEWLFTSGSEREKSFADTLSQSVKVSKRLHLAPLPTVQAAMASGDALLAVDSLPLHLAALAGVPTFSFFGPSLAAKYAPLTGKSFQGSCPYGQVFLRRCPKLRSCPTSACIKDLELQPLYDAVTAFLEP